MKIKIPGSARLTAGISPRGASGFGDLDSSETMKSRRARKGQDVATPLPVLCADGNPRASHSGRARTAKREGPRHADSAGRRRLLDRGRLEADGRELSCLESLGASLWLPDPAS